MAIVKEQIEGLAKQVFILEYLLNGLFPCQSDVVRLIRSNKRDWNFNDKFEYRMLLSTTNTGGTLNSQVFNPDVSLRKEGSLDYGIFEATYGTISDGFNVDMTANLETADKKAAFETDFATRMHSLRTNVASLFKNFAIHGKFGVVHQIRSKDYWGNAVTPVEGFNPIASSEFATGFTPTSGVPFTIATPVNVFASGFKAGKYLIKTTEARPDGTANVAELYRVLENQPKRLTLLYVGVDGQQSAWNDGEFLEVSGNREISVNNSAFSNWTAGGITVTPTITIGGSSYTCPYAGTYDLFTGTGAYTNKNSAIVGAMEGLADLFPWYTSVNASGLATGNRLGLDVAFRGQANRLSYTTEQAGGFLLQASGEHIIDAVQRGVVQTKFTVPYSDVGVWMNPITKQAMAQEVDDDVKVIRYNTTTGPIVYQRGVKETTYQVGSQEISEVVEDMNIPTDVIIIGPKNDMSYNCWDNSTFEIDKYIQETWSKSEPPAIENLSIPDEFVAKLDLSNRLTYGSPTLTDQSSLPRMSNGGGFRHPKNSLPIALHEMGALFTEYPYTYTIIKLKAPIYEMATA